MSDGNGAAADTVSVRDLVERAVDAQWAAFEAEHPRLAAVLDRDMVMSQAGAALEDDPEYRQAVATASAAGLGVQVLEDVVRGVVGKWVRGLTG